MVQAMNQRYLLATAPSFPVDRRMYRPCCKASTLKLRAHLCELTKFKELMAYVCPSFCKALLLLLGGTSYLLTCVRQAFK